MDDIVLNVAFNTELLHMGVKNYETINLTKSPHLAICGNSGSGKSYLLAQLIARAGIIGGKVWLADYKNSDDYGKFDAELHRYYNYDNVTDAITEFADMVDGRIRKEDLSRDLRILVLEEYGSFLNSLDKKDSDFIKKKVANLLFMARFTNSFVFLCSQRFFAEQMAFGSRDSCTNIILLSDPSTESLRSFCTSDEIALMKPHIQGEGYLVQEGKKPVEITVSTINDRSKLNQAILKAVTKDIQ